MKTLKQYLKINSFFSLLSGGIMILFVEELITFFGIYNAYIFPIIGLNLLVFSLFVWYIAHKHINSKSLINLISILDALWVIGSLIIVLFGLFELTTRGNILISAVAIWIAFLGYKQYKFNS